HKHISLIDIRESQEIHRFECGSNCETPVFSTDGKFIAAYSWSGLAFHTRGFIQIWDVETGRKRAMNTVLTACGCSIAFAPSSQTLATPQLDNSLPFWDVVSGQEVRRLPFPNGAPCAFVFTPDGKALIGGGPEHNPVAHIWDANT